MIEQPARGKWLGEHAVHTGRGHEHDTFFLHVWLLISQKGRDISTAGVVVGCRFTAAISPDK